MDAPAKRSRTDGSNVDLGADTLKKFPTRIKKVKRGFVKNDPDWDGCRCWLQRKNRYCKFAKFKSTEYCAHHLAERKKDAGDSNCGEGTGEAQDKGSNAKLKRVPCPYDPRHDVYEHRLKKHLKKCPKYKEAVAGAAKPYYNKNCNSCQIPSSKNVSPRNGMQIDGHHRKRSESTSSAGVCENSFFDQDEETFMKMIDDLYHKHVSPIEDSYLTVKFVHFELVPSQCESDLCAYGLGTEGGRVDAAVSKSWRHSWP